MSLTGISGVSPLQLSQNVGVVGGALAGNGRFALGCGLRSVRVLVRGVGMVALATVLLPAKALRASASLAGRVFTAVEKGWDTMVGSIFNKCFPCPTVDYSRISVDEKSFMKLVQSCVPRASGWTRDSVKYGWYQEENVRSRLIKAVTQAISSAKGFVAKEQLTPAQAVAQVKTEVRNSLKTFTELRQVEVSKEYVVAELPLYFKYAHTLNGTDLEWLAKSGDWPEGKMEILRYKWLHEKTGSEVASNVEALLVRQSTDEFLLRFFQKAVPKANPATTASESPGEIGSTPDSLPLPNPSDTV
jgi:hypothetical protein